MALSELTLQLLGFRVLALLVIVSVQGAAVAGAAVLLGDNGPKYDGRLTIVPWHHLDLLGTLSLLAFGPGWSKPVAVDAGQFRIGRGGILVVILAGFAALLATAALLNALILPAVTYLPHSAALTTAAFLRAAGNLALWAALLGLVPLPPLNAGLLASAVGLRIPKQVQWVLAALVLLAVAAGAVRQTLGPAHALLSSLIFGA